MRRATLIVLILGLSFLGLADSWYLAESAATDTPLVCGIGVLDGCNTVAQSPYAHLFGIPLGVYGVLFYALVLVLSVAALTLRLKIVPFYLLIINALGASASVVFLLIQFFLIKALCIYCMASAVISFALLGLSWLFFAKERRALLLVPEGNTVPS